MRVTPKEDKDLNSFENWPKGDYNFEVVKAEEKVSAKGNEMIELMIKLWNDAGKTSVVFDYLLDLMDFKLKHFCYEVGLEESYHNKSLTAEECVGVGGILKLGISKATQKYPDPRNQVDDYGASVVEEDEERLASEPAAPPPAFDPGEGDEDEPNPEELAGTPTDSRLGHPADNPPESDGPEDDSMPF